MAETLAHQKEMELTAAGTPSVTVGSAKNSDEVAGEEILTKGPGAEEHMDYGHSSLSQQPRPRWETQWMIEGYQCVATAATGYEACCMA